MEMKCPNCTAEMISGQAIVDRSGGGFFSLFSMNRWENDALFFNSAQGSRRLLLGYHRTVPACRCITCGTVVLIGRDPSATPPASGEPVPFGQWFARTLRDLFRQ